MLHRLLPPYSTSDLLTKVKTISGPNAAARTGQGAKRRGQDMLGGRALRRQVHLAPVKPRASRSDVQYCGFGVGQKWSIADLRRSKNTPPKKRIFGILLFLTILVIWVLFYNDIHNTVKEENW